MLTAENYFSPENQMKYMGSSQFKDFMDCEARALAIVKSEWEEPKTTAQLVGGYVDTHFDGTLDIFKAKHPEIFTQRGTLKSEYQHAEYIIQRIERDELFMLMMSGKRQVILTGEIQGVPVKVKIDCLVDADLYKRIVEKFPRVAVPFDNFEGAIVDMKIMKDFAPVWNDDKGRVPFIEAWGYDIQAAMYQEIERQNRGENAAPLPFFIDGATKEKPEPDLCLFYIPQERTDSAMEVIKAQIQYFDGIKKGLFPPARCEKCDYCKATKMLTGSVNYLEIA